MRILLDENLKPSLRLLLVGHEVSTVRNEDLLGIKNGALLARMSGRFDVLVTCDRQLPHQQNLVSAQIAVVVLRVKNTRMETLGPLVPLILDALVALQPGEVREVG